MKKKKKPKASHYAGDWRNSNFEKWRNDPMGFYHGMTVVRGKSTWVLVGPPVLFQGEQQLEKEEPRQLALF